MCPPLFWFKGGREGFLRVLHSDRAWGFSFEMTTGFDDVAWQDVLTENDTAVSELRHRAAVENDELAVKHEDSLAHEAQIAAGMDDGAGQSNAHVFGVDETSKISFADDSDDRGSQFASGSSSVTGDRTIPGYSAGNTFGFARAGLQADGIKQFWETGFWHDFFDPNRNYLSSFDGYFKRPVDPVGHQFHEHLEPVERKAKVVKVAANFMDHVKDTTVLNWKEQRDAEWQVAIYRWHAMLGTWKSDVKIVQQIFELEGFQAQAQVIVDIFYNRAPSTILKRCRSMSRMTNYFVDRGRKFPCGEAHIYEFLCVERENGAPTSRLKGFIEALTFCRHVLGVVEFEDSTVSRRCQGVASLDVSHVVMQADPLTVKQLSTLHKTLFEDAEIWNRVFAGMLLFCAYARARWSDAQHGEKLIEDVDSSGTCAFLEVATGVHKTAKALQLKHLYLPLVAPCYRCG